MNDENCPNNEDRKNEPFVGYRLEQDGLYFYPAIEKDKEPEPGVWLCGLLEVNALAVDEDDRWGKLLLWQDLGGNLVRWVMPTKLLADKSELWKSLLDRGLSISANEKSRNLLLGFLNREKPAKLVQMTRRLGWWEKGGACYVLPDRVIGREGEVCFSGNAKTYTTKGSLQEWQDGVARLCQGNSRLVFATCIGFAAPLLYWLNEPSGGFHFHGNSRIGKSSALVATTSLTGGVMQSWRSTDNGLEGVCEERCDGALVLDEMGEVGAENAGKIAYMIANGSGKQRADQRGDARQVKKWRLLMISSGEVTLADKLNEAGEKRRGGQEIRLVDIPADAGAGMGVLEKLHDGFTEPGEFIEHFTKQAKTYQGSGFQEFLNQIVPALIEEPELVKILHGERESFIRNFLPDGAVGQVRSACGRFAVVALGGELATRLGITGWGEGEATAAAATCFQAWLGERGTVGDHDIEHGIRQVIGYLGKHEARFECLYSSKSNHEHTHQFVYNKMGYRKFLVEQADEDGVKGQTHFYVLSSAWKEITNGYNPGSIAKEMATRGLLVRGERGLQSRITDNEGGRPWCYHLSPACLDYF